MIKPLLNVNELDLSLFQAGSSAPNPLAKAQLDLLSQLIGGGSKKSGKPEFRLNLFSTDEEEE